MNTPTRADASIFTWDVWRSGSIHDLGLCCRYTDITSGAGKRILRQHVVHWCPGETLMCRPKLGQVAIMCFQNGTHFWFHLRGPEFDAVFPGLRSAAVG